MSWQLVINFEVIIIAFINECDSMTKTAIQHQLPSCAAIVIPFVNWWIDTLEIIPKPTFNCRQWVGSSSVILGNTIMMDEGCDGRAGIRSCLLLCFDSGHSGLCWRLLFPLSSVISSKSFLLHETSDGSLLSFMLSNDKSSLVCLSVGEAVVLMVGKWTKLLFEYHPSQPVKVCFGRKLNSIWTSTIV